MTKILIIENEPAILNSVVEALELEGFTVLGAPSGEEGLATAPQFQPDLIISDIVMPGIDGYTVLITLRQDPAMAQIPFIFLTAKAHRTDIRTGMNLGADDYLTKPFTIEELMNVVNTRLEVSANRRRHYEAQLENLRSNVIYSLPHELRTPLTGIIGYTNLLLEDIRSLDPKSIIEIVESIHLSSERLHRVMENYLLYAQLAMLISENRQIETPGSLRVADVDLFVAECATNIAQRYQRQADLQTTVPDAPLDISFDNLHKIIFELVDNACKFSPIASPITVDGAIEEGFFVLRVADQGRGMTPEQIQNIGAYMQFNRRIFEQRGVGLGLVIAKELTYLHGGKFEIESQANSFTRVKISLPLRPQNVA